MEDPKSFNPQTDEGSDPTQPVVMTPDDEGTVMGESSSVNDEGRPLHDAPYPSSYNPQSDEGAETPAPSSPSLLDE